MPLKLAQPTYKTTRLAAQSKVHQYMMMPAPVAGLDLSSPLMSQDARSALVLDNFFVRRFGAELRPGGTRHTTNLGGLGTPKEVVSLMAYNPPRGFPAIATARLFAACTDGNIYDVTTPTNEAFVPVVALAVPGQDEPGEFSWTNFATLATNYLVICSSGGGVFTFDGAVWVPRSVGGPNGIITNPTPNQAINFDFVLAWKNRLWFINNNTTEAYYSRLPNVLAGQFDVFEFGPLFVHGGDLKALASWTVDGGDGIDDKLVVVAQSGDVLIYEGTDPSSVSTFRIVGRWYVGRPPDGRRFMSKYGGDLALVTEKGIEYMSRVMQARGELDPETQGVDNARRFNEIIGRDVRRTRGRRFWRFITLDSEESVILLTPHNEPQTGYQYCFASLGQAWSRHVGMAMACAEEFEGDLYYGTTSGTVVKAFDDSSSTDDKLSDGTPGTPVPGNLQTAFTAPDGNPMALKRPLLAQPMFTSSAPPKVKFQVNTEWAFNAVPGSPAFVGNPNALWDSAKWDVAVWSGESETYMIWGGVVGLGSYMSLRMSMEAAPRTVFTGWRIVFEPGGIM